MELYLAEAPAVFVCLSCFLARVSLKRSQWKFRFGESLPSSLMSSSERHTAWFPVELAKCNVPFYLQGRSPRNQIPLGLWNASEPSSSFAFVLFVFFSATTLLSVNFNCSFHLITSLTSSFSSTCSLFILLLGPAVPNIHLLEQLSLHLQIMLPVFRNKACARGKITD